MYLAGRFSIQSKLLLDSEKAGWPDPRNFEKGIKGLQGFSLPYKTMDFLSQGGTDTPYSGQILRCTAMDVHGYAPYPSLPLGHHPYAPTPFRPEQNPRAGKGKTRPHGIHFHPQSGKCPKNRCPGWKHAKGPSQRSGIEDTPFAWQRSLHPRKIRTDRPAERSLADTEAENKEKKKEAEARLTLIPSKHVKNICHCKAIEEKNKGTKRRIPPGVFDVMSVCENGSAGPGFRKVFPPGQKNRQEWTGLSLQKQEVFRGPWNGSFTAGRLPPPGAACIRWNPLAPARTLPEYFRKRRR